MLQHSKQTLMLLHEIISTLTHRRSRYAQFCWPTASEAQHLRRGHEEGEGEVEPPKVKAWTWLHGCTKNTRSTLVGFSKFLKTRSYRDEKRKNALSNLP